eukprot:scaffold12278_cov129-Isochrysis_galbana.AAC.1
MRHEELRGETRFGTVPKYSSCSVWCCGRSDCSGGSATLTPRAVRGHLDHRRRYQLGVSHPWSWNRNLAHGVRGNCPTRDKGQRDPIYRGGVRQGMAFAPTPAHTGAPGHVDNAPTMVNGPRHTVEAHCHHAAVVRARAATARLGMPQKARSSSAASSASTA